MRKCAKWVRIFFHSLFKFYFGLGHIFNFFFFGSEFVMPVNAALQMGIVGRPEIIVLELPVQMLPIGYKFDI